MAKKTTETKVASGAGVLEIPAIRMDHMKVRVVGDSPLIVHAWSEKAKKEMLDKQMGAPKQKKEAKNPERDFFDSLYWLTEKPENPTLADLASAKFGFPAIAFKAAAVSACRDADNIKMTEARGRFHINGEFVEIISSSPSRVGRFHPVMREDMVRVGMGTADIRYRGEFRDWAAVLDISYNSAAINPAQIANLLNLAGFGVGVGEWRPEKDGPYGRFHVAENGE